MNFEGFWKKLQSELKQKKEFKTLTQNKRFEAQFERNKHEELSVHVILQNGSLRGPISSNEFRGVWNTAKKYSHETRFVNKGRRLESYQKKKGGIGKSMQVSYTTTLIKHIVKNQEMI